jgi:molybdopterin synthase sulfur carrier subunit
LAIRIHVAGHLGDLTGRPVEIELEGARDVLDVIARLDARVPGIRDRILDEHDRIRPYINVYVNEQDIRDLDRESTTTKDGDVIYILPSVAGGKVALSAEEVGTS